MGLTDRFKDLKSKAEDAVVERKDRIQEVVEKTGAAADQRTGGKYHERIQKIGGKATGFVDKLEEAETDKAAEDAGGEESGAGT